MNMRTKLIILLLSVFGSSSGDYWSDRINFIQEEQSQAVGASITLSSREEIVNKILMEEKFKEHNQGFLNPSTFLPAQHFFHAKKKVEKSKVFQLIQKLPKGASLHGHDLALVSGDYLFNLTYEHNLYACDETQALRLRFFNEGSVDNSCKWQLVSKLRQTNPNFDDTLKKQITLIVDDPAKEYPDINTVWSKFYSLFSAVEGIVNYEPVFKQYFYQALKELREDNVTYMEFRGTIPAVYDLNGNVYSPLEVVGFYKEVTDQFVKDYPDFLGARFIYAPLRKVDKETALEYVETVKQIKQCFGDFLAGFDLVGQEDLGSPLTSFVDVIQQMPKDTKFFFHAGETDWYGTTTDFNLVDAILLNVTRLGHGYALNKHPQVLQAIKQKNIAVEVCPISNQVLKLVDDIRNHPSVPLIAEGYPIVICNDDPSFWGARGLSYDWYMAFMGMASREADLRLLKQLALNSLIHSAMSLQQKTGALQKWGRDWEAFLDEIISETK